MNKIIISIADDVSGLKTDVSQLKSDISQLKTDVSQLKTDVKVLKTDVSEIKDEHVRMDRKLDNIAAVVTANQGKNERRFTRIENHVGLSAFPEI